MTSSQPCWRTKTKDLSLASFVRPLNNNNNNDNNTVMMMILIKKEISSVLVKITGRKKRKTS